MKKIKLTEKFTDKEKWRQLVSFSTKEFNKEKDQLLKVVRDKGEITFYFSDDSQISNQDVEQLLTEFKTIKAN